MFRPTAFALLILLSSVSTRALAQTVPDDTAPAEPAPAQAPPAASPAQQAHHEHDDEIVVTGVRKRVGDVLGGVTVLDGADLAKEMRSSIGETLARQPGVSAS